MKTLKKISKQISAILIMIIILQSCVAYGRPIALEEAAKQTQKAKVIYDNDKVYRYQNLVKENGKYYGIDNVKGKEMKAQLDINRIKKVRVYSKERSVLATVLTPIVLAGVVIGIAAASYSGPSLSWGN